MKSLGRNKIFHHESQAGCIVSVWDAWILDLASPRTHKGKIIKKITALVEAALSGVIYSQFAIPHEIDFEQW